MVEPLVNILIFLKVVPIPPISEHSFANTTIVHNTNVKVVFDGESCKILIAPVILH